MFPRLRRSFLARSPSHQPSFFSSRRSSSAPRQFLDMATTYNDDQEWVSGDVTLLSADGVRFKVPNQLLWVGSGVLRNMIDTIGDKTRTISFTDAVTESADNIRAFLSLVRGEVPRSLFKNSNRELFALVPFLQKYDCVTPLNNLSNFVLHLYIDRNDEDTMDEGYALAFGALTDNVALCCRVIDDPLTRYSSEEVNGPRIPYEALLHLPPTYMYALYHTYRRERDWREARSVFFQEELAYAKSVHAALQAGS